MKNVKIHWGTQKQPFLSKPNFRWKQVHETRIAWPKPDEDVGEADGIAIRGSSDIISVVTADCTPILLASEKSGVLSALHAGWRGTLKNIVASWAQSVHEHGIDPDTFHAQIGPCIKSCCYEVSLEIIHQFQMEFPMIDSDAYIKGPRNLDLAILNSELLKAIGVDGIDVHPDCTFCTLDSEGQPKYFSYRRGDRNSRQFSSIQWSEL